MDIDRIPTQRLSALFETFTLKHTAKQLPDPLERAEINELSYREFLPQLRELSWLDTCGNIVFAGPPELGKTMLAVGLGLEAINAGYTVCFERMTNFVRILDLADTERAVGFRLRNIRKAQMVIIDEIGYTPISRTQANRFFTFISDTYETNSLVFTTNTPYRHWKKMLTVIGKNCLTFAAKVRYDMRG